MSRPLLIRCKRCQTVFSGAMLPMACRRLERELYDRRCPRCRSNRDNLLFTEEIIQMPTEHGLVWTHADELMIGGAA